MQTQDRVLGEFRPGLSVYIQGAVGEPLALRGLLAGAPAALEGTRLTSCLIPGINEFDYAALDPRASLTSFMMSPALRASFEAGRTKLRPLPYSEIARALMTDPVFDLAILQVAPPDARGLCSLGPCADFAPLVWPRARRILAFINPRWPAARRGPAIPRSAIDVAIEAEGPFITQAAAAVGDAQHAIAARVAGLIPDGAAVQSGIGGAPGAVIARLQGHRRLRICSGLVTEDYRTLAVAGALDENAGHRTGVALGSETFVSWAAETLAFADVTVTHGADILAATPRLFAINAALEVDLFGQANVEWRAGRLVSGLGGAADFARGARRSEGGRAILCLPATAGAGKISRIVPRLEAPTVSLSRDEADLVVTEHGVADLAGLDLDARARALMAVAAKAHREPLERAWRTMRNAF